MAGPYIESIYWSAVIYIKAVHHSVQAGDLQNAVVRLRSQLEQGEAQRHSLEYQLTLARKEGRQSMDLLEQRENEWNTLKQSLQGLQLKLQF